MLGKITSAQTAPYITQDKDVQKLPCRPNLSPFILPYLTVVPRSPKWLQRLEVTIHLTGARLGVYVQGWLFMCNVTAFW